MVLTWFDHGVGLNKRGELGYCWWADVGLGLGRDWVGLY